MILPTPSLAALTAALFVSSVASRPTEGTDSCDKDKQATEDDLVSIRYPSGEVRPLVDNVWFNGIECTKPGGDFNSIPHECLYRRICHGVGNPILFICDQKPEYFQKMEYERREIDSQVHCAFKMLCNRDTKPPQQSQEEQEREKAKQPKVDVCKKTLLEFVPIPKRCIYERAIQLGRNNTLYADQYHDSIDSCDKHFDTINKYPEQCVLEYTEKLDERFPPPAEEQELLKDKECGELNLYYKDNGNCLKDYVDYLNQGGKSDKYKEVGQGCPATANLYTKYPDKCARLLVEYTKKHSPDAKKDRYKNQKAKDGKPCSEFSGATSIEEIPEECLRPVFCNANYPRSKQGCPPANFRSGDVNKEELMKKVKSTDCAQPALCNYEDLYNLPE